MKSWTGRRQWSQLIESEKYLTFEGLKIYLFVSTLPVTQQEHCKGPGQMELKLDFIS
jgi:hypothetical protein